MHMNILIAIRLPMLMPIITIKLLITFWINYFKGKIKNTLFFQIPGARVRITSSRLGPNYEKYH